MNLSFGVRASSPAAGLFGGRALLRPGTAAPRPGSWPLCAPPAASRLPKDSLCAAIPRALALALGLLAGLELTARAEPPHPLAGTGYLQRAWSTEDGLPENSATAIVQTREGYLWFGTFRGLVRYNGDKFVVFDPANTRNCPTREL